MSGLGRWLDARSPVMPAELRQAVDRVLRAAVSEESGRPAGGSPPPSPPEQLAEAGLYALAEVARSSPERSTALDLLAADALLTFACEAASDAGPDAVAAVVAELDGRRFQAILERVDP